MTTINFPNKLGSDRADGKLIDTNLIAASPGKVFVTGVREDAHTVTISLVNEVGTASNIVIPKTPAGLIPVATQDDDGLMSSEDKAKLDHILGSGTIGEDGQARGAAASARALAAEAQGEIAAHEASPHDMGGPALSPMTCYRLLEVTSERNLPVQTVDQYIAMLNGANAVSADTEQRASGIQVVTLDELRPAPTDNIRPIYFLPTALGFPLISTPHNINSGFQVHTATIDSVDYTVHIFQRLLRASGNRTQMFNFDPILGGN